MITKTTKEIELDKYEYAVCAGDKGLKWNEQAKDSYEQKEWVSVQCLIGWFDGYYMGQDHMCSELIRHLKDALNNQKDQSPKEE